MVALLCEQLAGFSSRFDTLALAEFCAGVGDTNLDDHVSCLLWDILCDWGNGEYCSQLAGQCPIVLGALSTVTLLYCSISVVPTMEIRSALDFFTGDLNISFQCSGITELKRYFVGSQVVSQ